jgi:hypothetical protein
MVHHASVPVPDVLDEERLRVYFGTRDSDDRTRTAFIDVNPADLEQVRYVHDRPALELGKLGAFDDSGAMPSCLVDVATEKYLYYVGWNRGVTVPYRNSIGVAVSVDGGLSFRRTHAGPVLDRSPDDPYFVTTPFVICEDGAWRMWYASATGWVEMNARPEPVYEIKYAESTDGVEWTRENVTCIVPRSESEANGRPWVVRDGATYRMWYCYRDRIGYRTDPSRSYRIGYAESGDGVSWVRKDEEAGIGLSEEGWDSKMVEYPSVYEYRGTRHLLYNGNGFGESGIGHAVLEAG